MHKLCPARIRDFRKLENPKVQKMASGTGVWSETETFRINRNSGPLGSPKTFWENVQVQVKVFEDFAPRREHRRLCGS